MSNSPTIVQCEENNIGWKSNMTNTYKKRDVLHWLFNENITWTEDYDELMKPLQLSFMNKQMKHSKNKNTLTAYPKVNIYLHHLRSRLLFIY